MNYEINKMLRAHQWTPRLMLYNIFSSSFWTIWQTVWNEIGLDEEMFDQLTNVWPFLREKTFVALHVLTKNDFNFIKKKQA